MIEYVYLRNSHPYILMGRHNPHKRNAQLLLRHLYYFWDLSVLLATREVVAPLPIQSAPTCNNWYSVDQRDSIVSNTNRTISSIP